MSYYKFSDALEVREVARWLCEKDKDNTDSNYEGWLRLICRSVVKGSLDAHAFMLRSPVSGVWEYVSLQEFSNRIDLSPVQFGFYIGCFSFYLNVEDVEGSILINAEGAQGECDVDVSDVKVSHYVIISALLDLVKNKNNTNQDSIIDEIEEAVKEISGVKRSSLEKLFAHSNREMKKMRRMKL